MKHNQKQVEMLENRIKRLQYEHERAQKVTSKVTLKAEKILEARESKHQELETRRREREL
jgi:hypothetical protein